MSGETDLIERLRAMQVEMIAEGVNGWPNTVETAIEHLSTLEASDADTVRVPTEAMVQTVAVALFNDWRARHGYEPMTWEQMADVDREEWHRDAHTAVAAMLTASNPKPEPVETRPRFFNLLSAFRTTTSSPGSYTMTFKFSSMQAMHAADDEWHQLRKEIERWSGIAPNAVSASNTTNGAADTAKTQPEASRSPAPSDRAMVLEEAARIADAAAAKANQYYAAKLGGEDGMDRNQARYRTAANIAAAIRSLSSPPDEGVGS